MHRNNKTIIPMHISNTLRGAFLLSNMSSINSLIVLCLQIY